MAGNLNCMDYFIDDCDDTLITSVQSDKPNIISIDGPDEEYVPVIPPRIILPFNNAYLVHCEPHDCVDEEHSIYK